VSGPDSSQPAQLLVATHSEVVSVCAPLACLWQWDPHTRLASAVKRRQVGPVCRVRPFPHSGAKHAPEAAGLGPPLTLEWSPYREGPGASYPPPLTQKPLTETKFVATNLPPISLVTECLSVGADHGRQCRESRGWFELGLRGKVSPRLAYKNRSQSHPGSTSSEVEGRRIEKGSRHGGHVRTLASGSRHRI
jgi:hypothetical protein